MRIPRTVTQGILRYFNCKDTEGNWHYPSGVLTYEADYLVFVCFDNNPSIGQRIMFMTMASVADRVLALATLRIAPVLATLDPTSKVGNTGSGYNIFPYHRTIEMKHAVPFDPSRYRDSPDSAVALVVAELEANGYECRQATLAEQHRGIDIVARKGRDVKTFEVKSRRKRHHEYWRVFMQVGETNPGRIVS